MDAAQFLDHLTHTDTCNLSRALLALASSGQLIDADAVDYFIHIPVWLGFYRQFVVQCVWNEFINYKPCMTEIYQKI